MHDFEIPKEMLDELIKQRTDGKKLRVVTSRHHSNQRPPKPRLPYRTTAKRLAELQATHPERYEYYKALMAALSSYRFTAAIAVTGKSRIKTESDAIQICSRLQERLIKTFYGRQFEIGEKHFPIFIVIENHRSHGYHLHILLGEPEKSFRENAASEKYRQRKPTYYTALRHLSKIRFGNGDKQKIGEVKAEILWDEEGAQQYALKNLTVDRFIAVYEHSTIRFDRRSTLVKEVSKQPV